MEQEKSGIALRGCFVVCRQQDAVVHVTVQAGAVECRVPQNCGVGAIRLQRGRRFVLCKSWTADGKQNGGEKPSPRTKRPRNRPKSQQPATGAARHALV